MAWLQLQIDLTATDPAALEAALDEAGALAITLNDGGDQPLLEPGVGETPLWDSVTLTALFDTAVDTAMIEKLVSRNAGQAREWTRLEDRAWEREWLTRFAPRQFGPALWVVPGEIEPPDPEAANVLLDPGLAFGTGDHPTTSLCLAWIGHQDWRDRTLLDYGCGSGILAIAALKSGASAAAAVDIDPQALQATRDNARRNKVDGCLSTSAPDQLSAGRFDVVIANILAGPLEELAPTIGNCVAAGGDLVLSGILDKQTDAVMAAYETHFNWHEPRFESEWALLHGQRREAN